LLFFAASAFHYIRRFEDLAGLMDATGEMEENS
jgi:hypothetical protein